jgi:hypothetical protein
MVKELEVERAAHVRNDVHHVANNLLREWRKYQRNRELPLFLDDQKIYQQRIRKWLGEHDTTKRLTISKISRMKWSLLSQECGGDIATVVVQAQPSSTTSPPSHSSPQPSGDRSIRSLNV